jgi:hypothetical protein
MRITAKIVPGRSRAGGFAFADDANGRRYFIHCRQFREKSDERVLTDGAVLEFEVGVREGRPFAQDIVIVSAPSEDQAIFESLCTGNLRDANLDGNHRRPRKKQ